MKTIQELSKLKKQLRLLHKNGSKNNTRKTKWFCYEGGPRAFEAEKPLFLLHRRPGAKIILEKLYGFVMKMIQDPSKLKNQCFDYTKNRNKNMHYKYI